MAAPSLRSLGTAVATTTSTPSFSAPAGAVANDVILIGTFIDDGRTTVSAVPSGFTLASGTPQINDVSLGSPSHGLYVYWGRFGSVGAGPYAFTLSASVFVEGRTAAIQGCVTSGNPFEATNGATSGNTAVTTAPSVSATSLGLDRYAFYVATNWTGGAWTPATGFAEQWDANDEVCTFDDKALSTAQTVTPQAVCAGSNKSNAWVGILLPDSAVAVVSQPTSGPGRIGPAGRWAPQRFPVSAGTAYSQSLSGSLGSSGALAKADAKPLAGGTTPSGSLGKADTKPLASSVPSAGSLAKSGGKSLAGSLASSGAAAKAAAKAAAGSVGNTGAASKAVAKALVSSVGLSGALSAIRAVLRTFTGAVGNAATLTKSVSKALAGQVVGSGSLGRAIARALSGVAGFAGALAKAIARPFAGSTTPTGALTEGLAGQDVRAHSTAAVTSRRTSGTAVTGAANSSVVTAGYASAPAVTAHATSTGGVTATDTSDEEVT